MSTATQQHGPRAQPPPPSIPTNPPLVRRILVAFIANEVRKVGVERVVVGLSGGVDSAVSAVLAAEALGPANVLAIKMPYRTSSAESLAHADLVIARAGSMHSRWKSRRRSTRTSSASPTLTICGAEIKWRASA